MLLKSLSDIDLTSKRIILRVAFDTPLTTQGKVTAVADDSRIKASVPTLQYLIKQKCKIVILSWLGRPKGSTDKSLALDPVAARLQELIKRPVNKIDAVTGRAVDDVLAAMKPGDIVMLENVRFDPRETAGDMTLADDLAKLGDIVVFDAFAQAHRDTPSTTGLLARLPSVAGLSMIEEINHLTTLLTKPKRPFVVILGGAKISDKLGLIQNLINIADTVLIGGAMVHTFLKAKGVKLGASLIETSDLADKLRGHMPLVDSASTLLHSTRNATTQLTKTITTPLINLPIDLVAAPPSGDPSPPEIIDWQKGEHIPWDWRFLDIGPQTITQYTEILKHAKTVFWNGPLGYTEDPRFMAGTKAIATTLANSSAETITGGGDTLAALDSLKLSSKMSFASTGGGASLELLAGEQLPVLKYLQH